MRVTWESIILLSANSESGQEKLLRERPARASSKALATAGECEPPVFELTSLQELLLRSLSIGLASGHPALVFLGAKLCSTQQGRHARRTRAITMGLATGFKRPRAAMNCHPATEVLPIRREAASQTS